MFETQTEDVIKRRMLDNIDTDIDKSVGSLTYDGVAPLAIELAQSYIALDNILALAFTLTTSGDYLDMKAGEHGLTRNPGTKATGTVRFTGTTGIVIAAGTQIQTAGGLIYKTTATGATDSGGNADIAIESADIGATYNVPANAITQIPVQITGITGVSNSIPITGGSDIESDASLLGRLLIKVQTPSTSGNANDYRLWALSVAGIGDAKVFPLWDGNGTVKVVAIDSNKQPANATLISNVQAKIESSRPIGATVTVVAATALTINISFTVVKASGYTNEQVQTNVSAKVTAYLQSAAFKDNYISYAKIGNAIIESEGVSDYSGLTVNGGTTNISISLTASSTQVPVLGTVGVS